jgi:hypothetical protein
MHIGPIFCKQISKMVVDKKSMGALKLPARLADILNDNEE